MFLFLTALGAFFFQKDVGKFILLPLAHLAYCLASLNQVWFLRNTRKNLDSALLIRSRFLVITLFLLSEFYCATFSIDTPLLFPIVRISRDCDR